MDRTDAMDGNLYQQGGDSSCKSGRWHVSQVNMAGSKV